MKLGIALPQTDIGGDPVVVRDFAQAAEDLGYHHLAAYDHVLGANVAARPQWRGPYTSASCFHDVFVLFAFLAAQTKRLELTTQVLVLPQRQTALVAKQAASLDVLSGGRLRLGVGIGWNRIEYVGLGTDFTDRGARSEEQVRVLRALWAAPHVDFKGRWHEIPDAGLNPLPVRSTIPLWFGGNHDASFERIAKWGDGWITLYDQPNDATRAKLERLHARVRAAGRRPEDVGLDAWTSIGGRTPAEWRAEAEAWRALGATHLTLNTAFGELHHRRIDGRTVDAHLDAMRRFHAAVSDVARA